MGEAPGRAARGRQLVRSVDGLDLHLAHEIAQQHREETEHGEQGREQQRVAPPTIPTKMAPNTQPASRRTSQGYAISVVATDGMVPQSARKE